MWAVTLESHAADGLTRGAMAWPWGACCVCALSLAGLSHSGRGSRDLKLVSDGWDELLRRTGSRLPWDTRSVRRSLVHPSVVRVPEGALLGMASTLGTSWAG